MHPDLHRYLNAVWVVAIVVWTVGAFTSKKTTRKQSFSSRLVQVILFGGAFVLLFDDKLRLGALAWRFVPQSSAIDYAGLALSFVGVMFAIWARLQLGRNWSGTVTIKQDHELIRTGPYAIVRHPIYAGLAAGVLGAAISIGEVGALVAAALVLIGSGLKFRLEEAFMMDQFGIKYEQYKREVKALIPLVW